MSAKSDSLSVSLFFLPAMIHLPSARDTLTAGAPHSSRGSRCANDIAWQMTAKKATRTTRRENDIFSLFENELIIVSAIERKKWRQPLECGCLGYRWQTPRSYFPPRRGDGN